MTDPPAEIMSPGSPPRGRPIDMRKRESILDAAHRLFLNSGFQASSMDAIAEEAKVSKLTIYNHFGGKDALFAAVIERKCQEMLGGLDTPANGDARSILIDTGKRFVRLVTDNDAIKAHNVIVSERERAPYLGPLFYQSAVMNAARRVATLLEYLMRRGEIVVVDSEQAARDILAMWRAQPVMHIELGVSPFSDTTLDAHVERITDLFLKVWS